MSAFKEFDPQTGITTTVHYVDDANRMAIQKTYDAEPFLKRAAEMRAQTEGERWGDLRYVGTIPDAELATMLRQDGGIDMVRVRAWLSQNPALVTFSKYLKP